MNESTPGVTLALPAYNEEGSIAKVVDDSRRALEGLARSWEMIVIDNFSSDRTCEVVREIAARDPRVRLIAHESNRLYSGSCKTALTESRGRHVAIMDSDGQFTAADLPRFIEKLDGGANLVFGWRRKRHDSVGRKLMSFVFNTLGKVYLGFPLHDLNCGIRMFDCRFMEVAEIHHEINMANPELFVRAKRAGLKIDEVEIQHFEREEGVTSHNLGRIFEIFLEVNQYFAALRKELRA